ncbi:hypothetical protein [Halorussus sp. MSC15.2]|uniref:hypothetical protein n=1 Tax=Halorussus sp. MSC15.2 TaxID=2283638 RepID=UPI0013D314B7|nr:hypothetical protein [Halorussus sp. MSC15.2]NEU58944.1 hypothetical protein [Halorussus sp. MSC15.2]
MALSTNIAARWQYTDGSLQPSNNIGGQYYDMTLGRPNSDWTITTHDNRDYFGVYPNNISNSDTLPDKFEIPIDVALGALHPGIAFAVALDDFAATLDDNNGVNQTSDGWELTHHPASWEDRWSDASHFQRFFVAGPEGMIAGAEHLNIKTGCSQGSLGNTATEVEYSVSFFEDDEPSVQSTPTQNGEKLIFTLNA